MDKAFSNLFKSRSTKYLENCLAWSGNEFIVKKDLMDWTRFYYKGKEVVRLKMKTTELFKTYLEIAEDSPIKEPEFFICLFQSIFEIGD